MRIKKELKQLIEKLNNEVYFTTNPLVFDNGDDSYWGYKYFIVWVNAHNILYATRTQDELIEFLNEVKNQQGGLVYVGSGWHIRIFAKYV